MAKSKSAYSTPSKLGKIDTHIIVVWVDNEASVLSRVVGLFSGRGYNCLLYTSPSPRDRTRSRMPSSA